MVLNKPLDLDTQFDMLSKYVICDKKKELSYLFSYEGYFNICKYAKYALSKSNNLGKKPDASFLIKIYNFDILLRSVLFTYCKKAELYFKNNLSTSLSKQTNSTFFYLDKNNYTPSQSAKSKEKRKKNIHFFNVFYNSLLEEERKLRTNIQKYPEFFEIRHIISKNKIKNLPCWAIFPYFDFGTITNMYYYLNTNLRKEVLKYTYTKDIYKKNQALAFDTWLTSVRNLRNACAHSARIIGQRSNIIKLEDNEKDLVFDKTSLFARLYALKKVLPSFEGNRLLNDINKIIKKIDIDIEELDILPSNWQTLYNNIKSF